jgi:hemolysin activation/secretion protein
VLDDILSDVAFMNQSPYRVTSVVLKAGKRPMTTDVILKTEEQRSIRIFAGGDNTGTRYSGNARCVGGINWGNVFGWDHRLSYQYSASPDFHEFQSNTITYTAPIRRLHHTLTLFGGVSTVHPHLESLDDEVTHPSTGHWKGSGRSAQGSFRYEIPLRAAWHGEMERIVLGGDYKHFNNTLDFVSTNTLPVIAKMVNLTQLVGGYMYAKAAGGNRVAMDCTLFWAPGSDLGASSDATFSALRENAENHYLFGRFSLGDTYRWKGGTELSILFRLQAASGALLPSEQIGLGGFSTVRGYEERIFNSDDSLVVNAELHTPSISLLRSLGRKRGKDRLYFLIFADYAHGWNYGSSFNAARTASLSGVGPGLRYHIGDYLTLRFDYGFKLVKRSLTGTHIGKAHVSLIAGF